MAQDEAGSLAARHAHRAGPLLAITCCVLILVEARTLEFGSLSEPGPALWPTAVAVLTIMVSLVLLVVDREHAEGATRSGVLRVLLVVLALCVFIAAYEMLGFLGPGVLLLFFLLRFIGHEGWTISLIIAPVGAVVCYALFGVALNLPIESGFHGI